MSVGARVRNIDWEAKTSGADRYVGDVLPDGLLVARVLRSPFPHARIVSVDVSRARRAPGVAAILTAADLPDRQYVHEGPLFADRSPLATSTVRFVGEEIAVVAAETREQADAAIEMVRVRYRELRAVTTVEEAMAPGAPHLHDRRHGANVSVEVHRSLGSLDQAAAETATTISETYRFGRQTHACMETHGSLASWDADAKRLDLWTSTQSPYFVRKEVAHVLGLDMDQVVVHEVAVGGGFGAKSKITDHEVLAAAVAIRTGRPVQLLLSRDEEFSTTKSRHGFRIELSTGVDKENRLTVRQADVVVDNGAYNHSGPSVTRAALGAMASLYRLGALRARARLIDTNKQPGGQFRGYGSPQAVFAIESQMDELAELLGQDPIDFRILNANRPGDVTLAGWHLESAGLIDCLLAVREASGWEEKRRAKGGRGVGVAVGMHVTAARSYDRANYSEAGVDVLADGRTRVRFGGADPGTGLKTMLAQIAAEELGVEAGDVEVVTMSSDRTPFDMGSWSSRGTFMAGHAVAKAARAAADELRSLAAQKFGVRREEVHLVEGSARSGEDRIDVGELVVLGGQPSGELSVEEGYTSVADLADMDTGMGDIAPTYSFAAHVAEVEVDRGTGEIRLLDYVAAHDCGRPINPIAVESQIIGGVTMGLGAALSEELVHEHGRLVNAAYAYYALPRAADVPTIRPVLVGKPDPVGPYGAKGVGEISLDPVPAAVANAVANAVGVRVREIPLTPDRVLAALRSAT